LRQLLAGLLFLAELSCWPLWAQTNAAKAAPLSRRWLFLVETSKSMQPRAESVLGVVRGMLASDLSGQLQAGDTLGMWTFNEDLYVGRLPLQTWSPKAREEIMQRTVAFLRSQKYEKQARFNKVAPALGRLINDSELITVILISSGESKVQGLGIDGLINDYYSEWRKQQEKGRIPFIIVLRAQSGQLSEHAFNTALWPVQLPPLAPEMRSAEMAPERVPGAAPKNSPAAAPPRVILGKQPQPEPAQLPNPEPAVGKVEAPPSLDAAAITNEPVKVRPPEQVASVAEAAKTEPPLSVDLATGTKEPVKAKPPEPTVPSVEAAKMEPPPAAVVATTTNEAVQVKAPEPAPPAVEVAKAEPPPAVAEIPANNTAATPTPAPIPVTQLKQEIPTASEAKPVEPMPAKPEAAAPPPTTTPMPEPVTIEQPKASPAPQVATEPPPTAPSTHEKTSIDPASAAATQPASAATSSLAPRSSSLPTPPVQNATAVPAGTLTSHLGIWIAGLGLAIVAAICSLLLMRRPRATPQGSLITRSFEREKKP
jgi:hypothetical protein